MTRVARQSIIPHPIYLSIAEFHANSSWTILFLNYYSTISHFHAIYLYVFLLGHVELVNSCSLH